MSTAGLTGEQERLGQLLRRQPGIQFLIAVCGALLFWRLSSPRWVHLPAAPGPTSFADRFMLAGLPLLGLCMFLLCIFWAAWIFNIYGESSEPKLVGGSVAKISAKSKILPGLRLTILVVFSCAVTLSWGHVYVRFLWPLQATKINNVAGFVKAIALLLGLVLGVQDKKKPAQQDGRGGETEKQSWIKRRQVQFVLALLASMLILAEIIYLAAIYSPSHEHLIMRISVFLFSIGIVGFFFILPTKDSAPLQDEQASRPPLDAERLNGSKGTGTSRKKINSGQILTWVISSTSVLAILLPVRSEVKAALFFAPLILLLILSKALMQVKRRVLRLTQQGDYDEALRVDKQYSWIPGYGTALQGTVLFGAGRYAEAQALMKPLAFGANGNPLLTSNAFYIYVLALVNDGRTAEAQVLLEAAVRVPQRNGAFHVALATCLLSQDKDAERARELMEQAMSNWPDTSNQYESQADRMRRLARYAWALAACGRRAEAEAKLQEAFAGADGFRSGDLAGVQYFAGETWRVLGEMSKARAAFNEAIRLSPTGAAWTSAKKGLAKLAMQPASV